jgi:adenosylhomocysteine nucleosidase
MSQHIENSGVVILGGTGNISKSAIGPGAVVNNHGTGREAGSRPEAAIGVVTTLAEEAAAIRNVLGLHPAPDAPGTDLGTVRAAGRQVTVAAARALHPGEGAAVSAVSRLRACYRPSVMILTGIAGAIHPSVRNGDVVVATRVICYDQRKETPAGTMRRGAEFQAPATVGHAAGQFFTAHGDPALLPGTDPAMAFRVHQGPIGSGNAVIADEESEVRKWLRHYNDKILAIDMEADGFAMACHDDPGSTPPSWLVIRGISDDASASKNDDHHQVAAINAALTLIEILPYLPIQADRPAAR